MTALEWLLAEGIIPIAGRMTTAIFTLVTSDISARNVASSFPPQKWDYTDIHLMGVAQPPTSPMIFYDLRLILIACSHSLVMIFRKNTFRFMEVISPKNNIFPWNITMTFPLFRGYLPLPGDASPVVTWFIIPFKYSYYMSCGQYSWLITINRG